jgi:serine/threonine protein kinase
MLQRVAHYEVLDKLGEGGMGVVYKARDTRLERIVALKVLPADKVSDIERKRRFAQEAKAASALNHPNIVTIHDINSDQGVDFIAMEYIAGRTLDRLIQRQGMRPPEVLRCAVQIADALVAAHAAGIIHRDLKPGNIMVADSGLVKVLDFGLAKLTEKTVIGESGETETLGVKPETEEGHILGTIAYMSPEQAQGLKLDTRSDIFSFGALLYEMLTGHRAFLGNTKVSTLAAILNREPQPLAETTPRELDRIVTRCLRKDPARRFQTTADLKVALVELKEESDSGHLGAPAPSVARRSRWPFAAAGFAVVVLAAAGGWLFSRSRNIPSANRTLRQLTFDVGESSWPTLSPDGKLVAYQSDRAGPGRHDIWVQQTSGGSPLRLTKEPGNHQRPVFSSDGSRIYFESSGPPEGVYEVSALGGEPRLVAAGGSFPAVSPDGRNIVYIGVPSRQLLIVPAAGGEPRAAAPGFAAAPTVRLTWAPDSQRFVFYGQKIGEPQTLEWWVVPASGGAPEQIDWAHWALEHKVIGNPNAWLPGGVLLGWLAKDSNIQLYRFRLGGDLHIIGEPEALTFGGTANSNLSYAGGKIAFQSGEQKQGLWSFPADTNRGQVIGTPEKLTAEGFVFGPGATPSSTPDGKALAYVANRTGSNDIFVRDLKSGQERAVTANTREKTATHPIIDRAGANVLFTMYEATVSRDAYTIPVLGGASRNICHDCGPTNSLHPDGKQFLAGRNEGPRSHINLVDVETGKSVPVLQDPQFGVAGPRFSPDGKWIAFLVRRGAASNEVDVAPFRGPTVVPERDWIAVSPGPGNIQQVLWSPDGGLLYYLMNVGGSYSLMARRLDRSRHPVGDSFRVYQFAASIQPAINLADPSQTDALIVLPDRFVGTLGEYNFNISLMDLPR